MQTYQDIKSLTKKELQDSLQDARNQLLKSRITVKTKHEKDTSGINKQKKYIAQLNTALKQIQIEEMIEDNHILIEELKKML